MISITCGATPIGKIATCYNGKTTLMKSLYRIAFMAALLGIMQHGLGQLANPPYYIETIIHNGDYGEAGHDLSGYATYKVYIQFANANNYLTSVFAAENYYDCIQDADSSCFFDFPCGLFQHEIGTAFGYNQTCLYPALIPTSQYDSYLTIGKYCTTQTTCDFISYLGQCLTWQNNFEGPTDANYFDGGSFFWDEGAVFAAPCYQPYPTSLSKADANGRVFIGQFTTCGDMNACINLTYRDAAGNDQTQFDVCFNATMPCSQNPMDNTATVGIAGCAGDAAQVTLSGGGNGAIDYQLHDNASGTILNTYNDQAAGLTVSPIDAGTYYITMIDAVGCRDTTPSFNITEPLPLQFSAQRLTDVLCFGQTTGSIEVTCNGGTGVIEVSANNQVYSCGQTISNLGCGNYFIVATDENGCTQDTTISISCPAQLAFNPVVDVINCYGEDDGSIVGNITGGTGTLQGNWTWNGQPYGTLTGISPLSATINSLDGGSYDVSVQDENGCVLNQTYAVTEPSEYITNGTVNDASCFGFCDGTAIYQTSGGTSPYITTGVASTGANANLNQLCAGTYYITVTDVAGCILRDTIDIAQPDDITYSLSSQDVTCYGLCDGLIGVTGVTGGYGSFTYALTPNNANCVPPCNGPQVGYIDVCAGVYQIVITDGGGCTKQINNIQVGTPAPINIELSGQNITCFGFNNGEITVNTSGGTDPIVITPSNQISPFTFTNLAPGTYSYTITDANGCTDTDEYTLTEPDLLTASLISATDVTCGGLCDGLLEYAVEGGTSPYAYFLIPTGQIGVANGNINSLCANDYQLVITDFNLCVDTMDFEINEPAPLGILYDLDAPTCTGMFDGTAEVLIVGGTGPLELTISPDDTDILVINDSLTIINNLGEESIFFELRDSVGCRILDTLEIVPDIITNMVLTLYSSPETCWNMQDGTATVAVQNGNWPISYLWDDDFTQTTASATGLASNQEYTVIVTDNIGCTLSATVAVDDTDGCFFIANAITPNGDGSNDTWVLGGLEFYPDCKINVFNRWGQLVYNSTGYSAPWNGTYQGELLPVADYYFTIDYAADKEVIMGTVTIKY